MISTSELSRERRSRVTPIVPEEWIAQLLRCLWRVTVLIAVTAQADDEPRLAGDISYENHRKPGGPWSIHVVRVPRQNTVYQLSTMHATGKALGLAPVTDQTTLSNLVPGIPVAAINGDFYQREGPYAGDPRGLQIVEGEMISAPLKGASFCVNLIGEPQTVNLASLLRVTWPNGMNVPIGLNESRLPDRVTLYTQALGSSTRTAAGRELVLERQGNNPWLPLRPGRTYRARVREIRESGDTQILPGTMVLSIGPAALKSAPRVEPGAELSISTMTDPALKGIQTAISGGPVLVRNGKRQRFKASDSDSYEFSSMMERHPRSAIGWSKDYFFLVTVDGRQKGLSEGMNLNELASYLDELGCEEAMNLDGGGSATLWYNGKVRNQPCDGYERDVANSLLVCKRPVGHARQQKPLSAAGDKTNERHRPNTR